MSETVHTVRHCNLLVLVEDPLESKFLGLHLRRCDRLQVEVQEAIDLAQALTCLATHRIDLVLVDGREGLAWTESIRQAGYRHPVLLLTGPEADLDAVLEAGATERLAKGEVEPATLERAVLATIEKSLLQNRLDRRSARLAEANKALRQQNQEIQSFYQDLAGQLGGPLEGARELLTTVLEEMPAPLTEEQRECLQVVRGSLELTTVHVQDMVEVGRLEAGQLTLELQEVDLGGLVDTVLAKVRSVCADRQVALICSVAEGLPRIRVDAAKVIRVVAKLVDNAVKYTPPGGRVEVGVDAVEDDFLRVTVSDTGKGIPADERSKVFQRLYRGDGGERAGGLGLGLNICHGLVVLHGGDIGVEEDPAGGSRFWFTLPRPAAGPGPGVSGRSAGRHRLR